MLRANELKTQKTLEESQWNRKISAYDTMSPTYLILLKKLSSCGAAMLVYAYAKHAFMQYPVITSDHLMYVKNVCPR